MKKFISCILLIFTISQLASAQDLSNWVSGLSMIENAEYQLVDRSMLEASLAAAKAADSTGIMSSPTPPFMEKLESIDIINLSSCSTEVKDLFLKDLDNIQDEKGYETLINVVDDSDKVRIIAKREGAIITQIYVFAIDSEDNEIVIIRMNGRMDESDIADIIKQQQK